MSTSLWPHHHAADSVMLVKTAATPRLHVHAVPIPVIGLSSLFHKTIMQLIFLQVISLASVLLASELHSIKVLPSDFFTVKVF